MVVKFVNRIGPLCGLVVVCALVAGCQGIQECKVELLKYFGLSPLKYPVANSMVVCGNIAENCCSMEDEIRIYRLWKRFSVSQIAKHVDQLVKNYTTLFNYHEELLAVDIKNIEVKTTDTRKIPFKFKVCERIAHQLDNEEKALNSVDLLNNNALLDDPKFRRKLVAKQRRLAKRDLNEDAMGDAKISGDTLQRESEEVAKLNGRVLDEVTADVGATGSQTERELMVVLGESIKSRDNSIVKSKLADVEDQLKDATHLSTIANDAGTHNIDASTLSTDAGDRERGLKLTLQNASKNQKAAGDTKSKSAKITKRKRDLSAYEENSYSRPFVFEEELPERKVQCTFLDRVVSKRVTVVNKFKQEFCLDLRQKLLKFKINDFKAYVPDVKIEMNRLMSLKKSFYCYLCDIEKQKQIDSQNSLVTFDNHFCRRLVIDFRDYIKFQNVLIIEYIDMVLQYVRCFQTTADEARFPYASFLLMYQKNFETIQKCYDNIDKANFMDHCVYLCQQYSYTTFSKFFDGNPDLINRILMTLTSFFRKLRANQALSVDYKTIKHEFDLIDSIDFNMDFEDLEAGADDSIVNIGANGKRPTLNTKSHEPSKGGSKATKSTKEVAAKKAKRGLQEEKEYDLEASKVSQMSKEQYHNYMIEKTYKQGTKISWEKETEESHDSIYETRSSYRVSKVFRSIFVNDMTALDPLEVEPQLNFAINIKTLFKLQCDKQRKKGEKPEILQREVINEYFNANDDDIHSFATDLFMPFADYAFFQQGHEGEQKADENGQKKVIL